MGIGTKNCDTHILIEIYILQFIAEFLYVTIIWDSFCH